MQRRTALAQQRYAVTVVVGDVGWLTDDEVKDITAQINGGEHKFDQTQHELHLYWTVQADTMGDAIGLARLMLDQAQRASGVHTPRTIAFDVREIDSRTA